MAVHVARKRSLPKLDDSFAPVAPAECLQQSLKEQLFCDEIHWWFSHLKEPGLDFATEIDLATLSSEERDRRLSFIYERERTLYTEAHLLLRFALSQYVGEHPANLKFKNGDFGRPELDSTARGPRVRFSISHTQGLVTCAIVLEDDIGVDAEQDTGRSLPEVSQNFATFEQADLAALPTTAQSARFFEYWTLKESYLKARGLGLQLPLDSFWFLRTHDGCNLHCHPDVDDLPDAWQFAVFAPTSNHVAALAVRSAERARRKVRLIGFDRKADPYFVTLSGDHMRNGVRAVVPPLIMADIAKCAAIKRESGKTIR